MCDADGKDRSNHFSRLNSSFHQRINICAIPCPCVPGSLLSEGKESLTQIVLDAGPSGVPVGDACILHLDSCEGTYSTGLEVCIRKFAPAYMLMSFDSFFVCSISFLETTTISQVVCLIWILQLSFRGMERANSRWRLWRIFWWNAFSKSEGPSTR